MSSPVATVDVGTCAGELAMYDTEQPLGGFAARKDKLQVSGAMVVTELGVYPMNGSIRRSVAAVLLVALVGVASGQTTTVPTGPWTSLDLAGQLNLALQLRANGSASEKDMNDMALYVASRYASQSAAGPVNWGQWLDLTRVLGSRYHAETRTALFQALKQQLVPDEKAVGALSADLAAKLSLTIHELGQKDSDVLPALTPEGKAAWMAKVEAGLASAGMSQTLDLVMLRAEARSLLASGNKAAVARVVSAWLKNPSIQPKLATIDAGGLLQEVPWDSKEDAKALMADLEPVLLAQHGRSPLLLGTCTTLAYRLNGMADTTKAREWAVRAYQTYLGTEQAKAAADEELLGNLMGMPQIVAQDGQDKAATQMMADLEQVLLAQNAKGPLTAGIQIQAAFVWSNLKDPAKAQEWAMRAYQSVTDIEANQAKATVDVLVQLTQMAGIIAMNGRADEAGKMMTKLESLLLAQSAATPLSAENCRAMAFRWDSLQNRGKAGEWAVRTYASMTAEAKAAADLDTLTGLARMASMVALAGKLDQAQQMMNELEPLLLAQDQKTPLGWSQYKLISDCWRPVQIDKAREWAMRGYMSALGTEEARKAANEQTITDVMNLLKLVGLVDQVAADAVMAGLEPMWEIKAGQAPLQWETCRNFAEICLAKGDLKKAQEWAQRAYQIALGSEQTRAAANEGTLLGLSSILGKTGLAGEDQAYPEYVSVLIRLAKEGKLDARYWGGPESAIPGNTKDALPAIQAELFNGQGSLRLAIAQSLAWTYEKLGQLPAWQKAVDEKLTGAELSGDAKAGWLLTRAYAEFLRSDLRSPLAGKAWLDQALATASSASVRFMALKELVGGYMLIGEHDKAVAAMGSLTEQFSEGEIAAKFADLLTQVVQDKPVYAEAVARAKAEQEAKAARMWRDELQRRLAAARLRDDQETAHQVEWLLQQP